MSVPSAIAQPAQRRKRCDRRRGATELEARAPQQGGHGARGRHLLGLRVGDVLEMIG